MKKLAARSLLTLMAALFAPSTASAAARIASVTGNWNNTATWGGTAVPIATDTITVNAGITVTVPGGYAAVCSTIDFTTNSGASSINLADNTASLRVSGAVTIKLNGSAANTINVGAGAFSAASVALQGTSGGTRLSQILISTGTATVSGNVTSAGVDSQIVFSDAGTLNAGGTFLSGTAGTLTPSTGTVNFNAVGAQTLGAYKFNNLTLSGSGAKTTTGATVNGILSMEGTATTTGTVATYGASATLQYKGSAAQTTGAELPATIPNLTVNNAAGVSMRSSTTVSGTLTLTSGTFAVGGYTLTLNGPAIAGTPGNLSATSSSSLSFGGSSTGVSLPGSVTALNNLTNNNSSGVALNAGLAIGGALKVSAGTFNPNGQTVNVAGLTTVSGGTYLASTGTQTLAGGLTVSGGAFTGSSGTVNAGNVTLSSGTLTAPNAAGAFNVSGNWSQTGGTFSHNGGTVTLNGTSKNVGGSTFNHLTLSGTASATTTAAVTVSGNLVVPSGTTLTEGAFNLAVTGTTTVGGTLTHNSATGTMTLTGDVTINSLGALSETAAGAFVYGGNITINSGGTLTEKVAATMSCAGNLQNNGTYTASTGVHTFSGASNTLGGASGISIPSVTISGTYQNNGTLTVGTSLAGTGTLTQATNSTLNLGGTTTIATLTATASPNLVNYVGPAQTVKATIYNGLTLSGSGAKTLTSLATINSDLTMRGTATATTAAALTIGGNLNIGDGTTFAAAAYPLTVSGVTTVGGGTSGNLTISSATGAKLFTGLVTINAGGTWNNSGSSAVTFRGGIANNGTLTAGTGVYTFDTITQTLTGTFSIPSVTVTAVTLNNSGTLTVGTALAGTGGLAQGPGATLSIGGTSGITTLTATASGNTVKYTGAAQTLHANNYYHLTLSGSGTDVLQPGMTTISGNMALSGTVAVSTVVGLTIGGNLNVGSGTTLTAANNLGVTGTTTVDGTLTLSGSNMFTGGVTLNATGRVNLNSATALGGGRLTINGGKLGNTSAGAITLSFASAQNWNGDFTFAGSQNLNLGTGAATLNSNRIVTVSANTLTINGAVGGAFSLTKAGTGTLALTGNNTFGGMLTVQAGVLSIPTINDANAAGPLGQSANAVVLGGTNTVGTLLYAGGTASSTKQFAIGVNGDTSAYGGVIQVTNAATALTLSGSVYQVSNGTLTSAGPGTLLLAGTDDNVSLRVIAASGTNVLAKTSDGSHHAIGGPGLTLSGGTVRLAGTGGDQIYDPGVVTVNSGTLDLNKLSESFDSLAGSGGTVLNNGGGASTLTIGGNNGGATYSGIIADNTSGTGTLSLVKTGAGTQTLGGSNKYTGGTTVGAGTLTLDYTTVASKLADTGVLNFSGGTLNLANGASAHTEVVGSTTIKPGASSVTRASGTSILRQNVITRNIGGTVDYGAASIAQADNALVNGILGGWATLAGADWAASGGVNDSPITAYAGYTTTFAAGSNVSITNSPSQSGVTVNSLRLAAASGTQTLTITSGALTLSSGGLLDTGAGAKVITGGTLQGAPGKDLVVLQNSPASLTISSAIADNTSATALAKSGTGILILNAANSYSGGTYVNAGTLDVQSTSNLGSGNVRVASGATLTLESGTGIAASASLLLNGSAMVTNSFSGTQTIAALSFDGGATFQAAGTWGAVGSTATHQDAHFAGAGILNMVIPTATAVSSSLNPSAYGQSVTLTATVTGTGGTPTGSVQFQTNGVNFGSAVALTNGSASLTTTALLAGSYPVTARFTDGGSFATSTGTLSGGQVVNKAALTITASAQSKIYGTALSLGTTAFSVGSGLAGSESVTAVTLNANGGTAATDAVGSYTITPSVAIGNNGFLASNYNITYATGTLTINPKALTVTADAKSKTYGDADPGLTYQLTSGSLVGSDTLSGSPTRVAGVNVGTYAIQQGTLAASANYALTYVGANLSITPKPLLAQADDKSRGYGQANPAFTISYTGFVGSDSVANLAALPEATTLADTNSPVGTYDITLAGGSDTNYSLVLTNGTLTVTLGALTVTADCQSKVYGESDPALTYQITSGALMNGDSLAGSLTRAAGESVGAYAIQQGTLAAGTNYTLTFVPANLTISTRPINVTADAKSKAYGQTDPALTAQVTSGSLVGSDSLSGSLTRVAGENVGSYAIQQGTLAASANYTLTYSGADLTIAPKPITVTADAKSKTYGDSDPALTSQITSGSLIGTDSLSGSLTRVAGENAGSYAIQQGGLTAGSNYDLTFVSADLTISTRPITVTADAKSKVYGDSDPALTSQITSGSLIGTDSLSGSLTRVAGENAGSNAIQQGTLGASGNYALTYVGANLSITPKPLLAQADDKSRAYGANNPAFTISYTGFVGSDDVAKLAELPQASTLAATDSPIGTYDITLTGGSDTNYSLVLTNGTLTVTLGALTVTADAESKVYGESDPALTYQITSGALMNGDSLAGSLTRTAGEDVGSYAIQQGTLAAGTNYTLTFVPANLAISARPITVTADAKSKAYGESDPALTAQVTSGSLVGSDSLGGSLTRVTGENAGAYAIQQGTLTAGDNYNLTYVGADLTISPVAITVTADAQSKTYGDADPALTYQVTSGTLASGDSLSGALSRESGENVGSYAIQQGTLAVSGNYALTYVGANLTITARPLTVTAVPDNKLYDGTDTSGGVPIITAGSLVNGDTATWSQVFNTKDTTADTLIPSGSVSDGNGGSNYNVTFAPVPTQSIHRRPVTAKASDATRAYGADNPTASLSYDGFIVGEDDRVLSGTPGLSTAAGLDSNVGDYDINVDTNGITALNYYLAPAKGKLTITKASATVSVGSDKWTVPPTNSVTFAVSASAVDPSRVTPSGSVQFVANGTNNLGSPVALVNGQAALSVLGSALRHGSNTITAVFSDANGNFNGTSGDLNPRQVVNIPPVGGIHSLGTVANKPIAIGSAALAGLDVDADADPLNIVAVSPTSANGIAVTLNAGKVHYTPQANYVGTDSFTYAVADPFGGLSTGTANVTVRLSGSSSVVRSVTLLPDQCTRVVAVGLSGRTYLIQASTDLQNWSTISTNVAAADGLVTFVDSNATNFPGRYYQLAAP